MLADDLGMRPFQAHGHRSLGTLYATIGQREQARTALSTAINLYRAMEMTFWPPEAEAGLSQVEGGCSWEALSGLVALLFAQICHTTPMPYLTRASEAGTLRP